MTRKFWAGSRMAPAVLALAALPALGGLRWACIGDSITRLGWPDSLQTLLPPGDSVLNAGDDGCTATRGSDNPYWQDRKFPWVFAFRPAVVTILLGTNDTRDLNWPKVGASFEADYRALVDTVLGMPSRPKVLLLLPIPAFNRNFGIDDSILRERVLPAIRRVAALRGLPVLDLRSPMLPLRRLTYDGIHPTGEGNDSLAAWVLRGWSSGSTRLSLRPVFRSPGAAPFLLPPSTGILSTGVAGFLLLGRLPDRATVHATPWTSSPAGRAAF